MTTLATLSDRCRIPEHVTVRVYATGSGFGCDACKAGAK